MRYAKELKIAKAIARKAGEMLCAELHLEGGPRGRGDKAPIDNEVEEITRDALEREFADHGIIGEEYPHRDRPAKDDEAHIWFIDPNDGTWGFLKGWRGSAFSLGLMRNGVPILGVVMAHSYPDDAGVLFAWAEGMENIEVNGEQGRQIGDAPLCRDDVVLVSQSADDKPKLNSELAAPARYMPMPSIAHRLALAATGGFAVATSLNAPDTLDVLAGHALLIGAGGEMYDSKGEVIRYSRKGQMHHRNGIFGGRKAATEELCTRLWVRVMTKSRKEPRGERLWLTLPETSIRESNHQHFDRGVGALLGALVGDALGSQVEFKSAEAISREYPNGVREMLPSPVWKTEAGQPTDDGELMLMLARALVEVERLEVFSAAENYVHWYRSKPFDIGNTISCALHALSRGEAAHSKECKGKRLQASQANGALMRAMPIGVFGVYRSDQECVAMARADAALTHPNSACLDANEIYCLAIKRLILGEGSAIEVHAEMLSRAESRKLDAGVIRALEDAKGPAPVLDESKIGWFVLALQNAFHELLRCEQDGFEECLVRTVGRGGDTDTNAAIAGGLIGAYLGASAMPAPWKQRVLTCRAIEGVSQSRHPRPPEFWPVDVERLAETLLYRSKNL